MAVHWGGRGPGHVSRGGGLFASLRLDFLSNVSAIDPRITFTRASSATRVNASGLIETVSSNVARFDYDHVTLAPKGLLIEEQRTNLALQSAFAASWSTLSFAVLTANQVASPDGTTTGAKLDLTTDTSSAIRQAISSTGANAFSMYMRGAAGGEVNNLALFNATDGLVRSGSLTHSTAWARQVLLATVAANSNWYAIQKATSPAAMSLYVWGAQLEAGAFATSMIPTAGATATRAPDTAIMTGSNFTSWYNSSAGTFIVEADTASPSSLPILLGGSTLASRAFLFVKSSNIGTYNGAVELATTGGAITANTPFKAALAYDSTGRAICVNGGTVASDANVVDTSDGLYLGRYGGSTVQMLNGHLRRVTYYPFRLSNAQIQALTA